MELTKAHIQAVYEAWELPTTISQMPCTASSYGVTKQLAEGGLRGRATPPRHPLRECTGTDEVNGSGKRY